MHFNFLRVAYIRCVSSLFFFICLYASASSCRGSLTAYEPTPITRYPNISSEVSKKLKTLLPTLDTTSLDLFLAYHYGAMTDEYKLPVLSSGRPFKQLKKIPYDLQIEFFTRIKNSPLLYEEVPENVLPFNQKGSPQYLREHEKAALIQALAPYDLPDIESGILKLFPIQESQLIGTFDVIYTNENGSYAFKIDTANDGTAVLSANGKIFEDGQWSLNNGLLALGTKSKHRIDLRSAVYNSLIDGHIYVGRIHEWGPIGVVEVYFAAEN